MNRIVRFAILCGLGALLALSVFCVTDSGSEVSEVLPNGIRRLTPPWADTDRVRQIVRSDAVSESSDAVPRGESEVAPTTDAPSPSQVESVGITYALARQVPSNTDSTRSAPKDVDRPLAWCFFTTLDHEVVSDSNDAWNGSRSALIREISPVADSAWKVNALWQAVDGVPYRNSRVQFTVHVKGRGGVFLFLQGATERELLLANNQLRIASSSNRYFASIADAGWMQLAIVSEIQEDTDVVYFGIAQNGSALLRLDDVRVADVGANSAVTSTASNNAPLSLQVNPSSVLAKPTNLDFEMTSENTPDSAWADQAC